MMVRVSYPLNRREFLGAAAITTLAGKTHWMKLGKEEKRTLLFVGTQTQTGTSKGIYAYRWDSATGNLTQIGVAAESDDPTFLALSPDSKYLYAANEVSEFQAEKTGAISSFQVDAASAKLKPLNKISSQGTGPCHVSTDSQGRYVFCANYTGGSAASFYVHPDGAISEAVSHFHYDGHGPNAERQQTAHAHRATTSPDDRLLLVNDLGLDCIHIYKLNPANGRLTLHDPPQWNATPGSGPRALRFHPNGRFAYCIHELTSELEALHWDAAAGTFTSIDKAKLTPDNYHGPAAASEIVIDRSGKFAYAACRFYDSIITFAIHPKSGKLTLLTRTEYGGKVPRHITLDPTERRLLIANQGSDDITVLRRDPKSGHLEEKGKTFPLSKPQCLVFV